MAEVRISGASDDLIEVDGDIREEFNPPYDADSSIVACSNGVLLRIAYTDDSDDGIWRIAPLAGADKVQIWQCPADDERNYSDIATIHDPALAWVALASDHATKKD